MFLTENLNEIAEAIKNVIVIRPEGTLGITENGTFDVTEYAAVQISVQDEPDPELDAANAFLEAILNGTYEG